MARHPHFVAQGDTLQQTPHRRFRQVKSGASGAASTSRRAGPTECVDSVLLSCARVQFSCETREKPQRAFHVTDSRIHTLTHTLTHSHSLTHSHTHTRTHTVQRQHKHTQNKDTANAPWRVRRAPRRRVDTHSSRSARWRHRSASRAAGGSRCTWCPRRPAGTCSAGTPYTPCCPPPSRNPSRSCLKNANTSDVTFLQSVSWVRPWIFHCATKNSSMELAVI